LKIGDSIIGEEILLSSSLKEILESHVSITNPLIVNASITRQEEEHSVAILIVGILI
jgi:hypothetical protein